MKKIDEEEILKEFDNYKLTNRFSENLGRIYQHFLNITLLKRNWKGYSEDWHDLMKERAYMHFNRDFSHYNPSKGKISSFILMSINFGFIEALNRLKCRNNKSPEEINIDNLLDTDFIPSIEQDFSENNLTEVKNLLRKLIKKFYFQKSFCNDRTKYVVDTFIANDYDIPKTSTFLKVRDQDVLMILRNLFWKDALKNKIRREDIE